MMERSGPLSSDAESVDFLTGSDSVCRFTSAGIEITQGATPQCTSRCTREARR